jgi:hypothetical protein
MHIWRYIWERGGIPPHGLGEWSASRHVRFPTRRASPRNYETGNCASPRTSLAPSPLRSPSVSKKCTALDGSSEVGHCANVLANEGQPRLVQLFRWA